MPEKRTERKKPPRKKAPKKKAPENKEGTLMGSPLSYDP